MLNGYSGYAPASFYEMRELMSGFPDDRSIAFLRRRRVDYVVIRTGLYDPTDAATCSNGFNNARNCRSK